MEQLINDPRLIPIAGTFNWRLAEDFIVRDDVLGLIVIPQGFITDLGSIPRLLWNLIPPEGPATDAYVVHDYLYATQKVTQSQADNCLLRLLEFLGIDWPSRHIVYGALRCLGWIAWNEDKKKIIIPQPLTP